MTCKDCIHYDVCSHCYIYEVVEGLDVCKCEYFKDKSRFGEIRRGKWIDRQLTDNPIVVTYRCSACGAYIITTFPGETKDFPYCHCGAKMELGE